MVDLHGHQQLTGCAPAIRFGPTIFGTIENMAPPIKTLGGPLSRPILQGNLPASASGRVDEIVRNGPVYLEHLGNS